MEWEPIDLFKYKNVIAYCKHCGHELKLGENVIKRLRIENQSGTSDYVCYLCGKCAMLAEEWCKDYGNIRPSSEAQETDTV